MRHHGNWGSRVLKTVAAGPRDALQVALVRFGVRERRGEAGLVAHRSVGHRPFYGGRAAALFLAAVCAPYCAALLGGVALADPSSPSPSPSVTLAPSSSAARTSSEAPAVQDYHVHLALSSTRGAPGTTFTATATVSGGLTCDPFRTAVAEGDSVTFTWQFGQQEKTTDGESASLRLTVPENATPGRYSVTASCTYRKDVFDSVNFTVTEKPSLTLSPGQGAPGARITAATKGFDACLGHGSTPSQPMSWRWDSGSLQAANAGGDGSTVTFAVPTDAVPSDKHAVTVLCGNLSASAPFTVTPTPAPVLNLDKDRGPPGSPLTANGTGFACGDDHVDVLWDGKTSVGQGPAGEFSVPLAIPADASTGQHTVVAMCRNHTDITGSRPFTVMTDVSGGATPAALAIEPAHGSPGDRVHVTGDGFSCNNSRAVVLLWDDQRLADTSANVSGHLDTSVVVPADARASSHIVRVACSAGKAAATAGFTVLIATPVAMTAPPTSSPQPPQQESGGFGGWMVLLILGVAAVLTYRHWRKPRPKPTARVYAAVLPASGLPVVTTNEAPTHGEVSHSLSLRTHADLGTQIISEVDDDDTAQ